MFKIVYFSGGRSQSCSLVLCIGESGFTIKSHVLICGMCLEIMDKRLQICSDLVLMSTNHNQSIPNSLY